MSFLNPSFESSQSEITGWTAVNERVYAGGEINIDGTTFMAPSDPQYPYNLRVDNNGTGGSEDNNDAFFSNNIAFDAAPFRDGDFPTFTSEIVGDWQSGGMAASDGSNAVKLSSGEDGYLVSGYGFGVIRGPWIYSSEFSAGAGQTFTFDWQAAEGEDAFDVMGFLLNTQNGLSQIVLDETGGVTRGEEGETEDPVSEWGWGAETSSWVSEEVVVDATGNYRFVFFSGSFDETGGRALGADLFLDNFAGTAITIGAGGEGETDDGTGEVGPTDTSATDGTSVNFTTQTAQQDDTAVQSVNTSNLKHGDTVYFSGEADKELHYIGGRADDVIVGGAFNDNISTGSGDDTVTGGYGNDVINGGYGSDELFGEAGDDTLSGGHESDTIYGGDGNDVISGGNGTDEMYGGSGNDVIMLSEDILDGDYAEGGRGEDTFVVGSDYLLDGLTKHLSSVVGDFSSSEGDRIEFENGLSEFSYYEGSSESSLSLDFGGEWSLQVLNAQHSAWIVADASTATVSAIQVNGGVYVFGDTDNDGDIDAVVGLEGATLDDLSANSFII